VAATETSIWCLSILPMARSAIALSSRPMTNSNSYTNKIINVSSRISIEN
jgi:hypothetical protein